MSERDHTSGEEAGQERRRMAVLAEAEVWLR